MDEDGGGMLMFAEFAKWVGDKQNPVSDKQSNSNPIATYIHIHTYTYTAS